MKDLERVEEARIFLNPLLQAPNSLGDNRIVHTADLLCQFPKWESIRTDCVRNGLAMISLGNLVPG